MHPIFAKAGETSVPILFVTAANFDKATEIIDDRERLHSLLKADLREYTISKASPMPSYKGTLSDEEIADVLAYLLSLKGEQP